MQLAGPEVDVIPPQSHELTGAQSMPIGQQDGSGVPMTPAVAARGIHELLDLPLGQILAWAGRTADLLTGGSNCYI